MADEMMTERDRGGARVLADPGELVTRETREPAVGTVLTAGRGWYMRRQESDGLWHLLGLEGMANPQGYEWPRVQDGSVAVASRWRLDSLPLAPREAVSVPVEPARHYSAERLSECECGDPEWGPRRGHDVGCPERRR